MRWTDREELLFARLAALFHTEFQPVQRELAALVSALDRKELGNHQLGAAVSVVESDLRALIGLIAGVASKEQKERILSVVEAHADIDRRVAEARKAASKGKVVPFKKRRKKPALKPSGPDAA